MPEPGETFQTVESALSLCGQDTEASGAEVPPPPRARSRHPDGTRTDPGPVGLPSGRPLPVSQGLLDSGRRL